MLRPRYPRRKKGAQRHGQAYEDGVVSNWESEPGAYDECHSEFTPGQAQRMRDARLLYRA